MTAGDANIPNNPPINSRPRTPLSQRLETLVDSEAPRMQAARKSAVQHMAPSSTQPILRWLGTWSPYKPASPKTSPPSSCPPFPDEPIAVPATAHLPDSFSASRALSRPPPFLDNLTRSTLPTASISPSSTAPEENPFHDVSIHSPPKGSSVAVLRSLSQRDHRRSRSLHTLAAPESPVQPESTIARWWFQSENKDNVDALLDQEDRADSVQQEQRILQNKYRSPKNPVVFCHGLLGFDSVTIGPSIAPMQVTHWRGIKEVLEANGTEVLITRVPATSSPIDRAKVLEKKISEAYPGRSVHLGGLDCRYLTTHLTQRKFRVLSITTIATPHRGSSFADHFLTTVGRTRMPSVLSLLDLLPNGGGDGKAFECLTIESMRKFNAETPDDPTVRYFSYGATYEPGLIDTWKWPHSVVLEHEGENDGLVSVASSQWGTYLGTLTGVSHLNLVGWINPAQYKWAEMMGREITFRPATFYLGIADMLAEQVEGQPAVGETQEGGASTEGNEAGRGVKLAEDPRSVDEPASTAEPQQQQQPAQSSGSRRTSNDTPRGDSR
ncbi:Alpha/Beta hydrolase protein [Mycena alexandri]|uniref:Alpha/Beta hydrolase protein n=1 Tax=Mycena alexandri TaxID=1745969 RepID=A0AAD6XBZ6_9AGAR|nr:Alpha/Beta hydrolase protein [Mycena alexandri]